MRMWMVDPRLLCRQHLLGEHSEIHKHRHNFVKGHSVAGRRGQIEPMEMERRHDALAREMERRGYRHQSPYEQPDLGYLPVEDREGWVDREESTAELSRRCSACRRRIDGEGRLAGAN